MSGKQAAIIGGSLTAVALSAAVGWFVYTGEMYEWLGMNQAEPVVEQAASEPDTSLPEPLGDPQYLELRPPFLVNFEMEGKLRYLQVSMSVMSRREHTLELLELHMAPVRNNILLILSDQKLENILTADSKEALRESILKEIQFVMTQVSGDPVADDVYFTSFVMQ